MAQLREFMLPAEGLPPDPSNAYGDDLEAAQLGKLLFFETRFSGSARAVQRLRRRTARSGTSTEAGKVSCASCHDPLTAGADRRSLPPATSLGVSYTHRNAPTVINAAYSPCGSSGTGAPTRCGARRCRRRRARPSAAAPGSASRWSSTITTAAAFEDVFGAGALPDDLDGHQRVSGRSAGTSGDRPVHRRRCPRTGQLIVNSIYANFGKAIAAYERRLVSTAFEPSPFDAFMAGDASAMSPAAIRGARLFVGRAGCAECHSGSMFTDYAFHNIGVPQTGQYPPATDDGRSDGLDGAENVVTNIFNRAGDFSDDKSITKGDHLQPTQPPRLHDRAVQDAEPAQRQQDRPLHARRRLPDVVGRGEPLQLRRLDRALFGNQGSRAGAAAADRRRARRPGRVPARARRRPREADGRFPEGLLASRRCRPLARAGAPSAAPARSD